MTNAISMPTPLILSKGEASKQVTIEQIGTAIIQKFNKQKEIRQPLEETWDETYELYRAGAEDIRNLRNRAFVTAGAEDDWRHRVNTGVTFEIVETLVAYLKGATFPSDDWFDLKGTIPDLGDVARLVKQLAKVKLEQVYIRDIMDVWLRWLCIFGVATYRVGWESRTERQFTRTFGDLGDTTTASNKRVGKLTIEPLLPYDVWLDSGAPVNQGGVFTRLRLTREELFELIHQGYYRLDKTIAEQYQDYKIGDPSEPKSGMHYSHGGDELIEYYGPMLVNNVHFWCVHAVFYGKQLIRLADSDYWCGVPFVSATMLPDRDSVYGMSVLHPNLGALHILNVLTNSRLDNIAVHIAKMWTMVEDGILKREDVKAKPGAVFKVAQHGNLQPVDMGRQDFAVTYQEQEVQERSVYRTTSTGPLIGNAQPRSGERVTAAEIQGVRDAGGNRLSSLHTHIEDMATLPLLSKTFTILQQYYVEPELVRMYMPEYDADGFFSVEPDYLQYPYAFIPLGASYVVERERTMNDILQLLDISGRVPQIGQLLDYGKLLEDLLRQMKFNNPKKYLMPQAQPQATEPQPPDLTQSLGGDSMATAMQTQMSAAPDEMLSALGIDTSSMPPEALAAMMPTLQQGITTNAGSTATDPTAGL